MGVWVVRTKSDGRAFDLGIIPVGWDLDLTPATTRDGIEQLYREKWPQARDTIIGGRVDQLWDFRFEMKVDDLIIMPRRTGSVAIGRVTGPFRYRPDLHGPMRMTHQVEWLDTDLPASALGEDIRRSLLTFERFDVYPIRRSGIDALILAALGGQKGRHMPPVDVETYAGIAIQNAIGQVFPGYRPHSSGRRHPPRTGAADARAGTGRVACLIAGHQARRNGRLVVRVCYGVG